MSCRLLVMLVFILIPWKSQSMIESTILNQIEGTKKISTFIESHFDSFFLFFSSDCFYEKRRDTSLSGYNDLHDRWISELDCLDRCLKLQPQACRSFEHWHSNRHGLCVLANLTLTDQPYSMNSNLFVNYYEIHCEKDTKGYSMISTSFFLKVFFFSFSSCSVTEYNMSGWTTTSSCDIKWYWSELYFTWW